MDCFGAALEFNNIAYAWWNDRNGERRYFWSGNDHNITSGRHYHTCQCGLENSCQDKNLACNCDSVLGLKLSDKGTKSFSICCYLLIDWIYFIFRRDQGKRFVASDEAELWTNGCTYFVYSPQARTCTMQRESCS